MSRMSWRSALVDMVDELYQSDDYRIGPRANILAVFEALRVPKGPEEILAMPEMTGANARWYYAGFIRENL